MNQGINPDQWIVTPLFDTGDGGDPCGQIKCSLIFSWKPKQPQDEIIYFVR